MILQRLSTPLLPLFLLLAARSAPQQDAPVEDPDLGRLRAWAAEIVPQVEELRGLEFLRPVPLVLADPADFRAYALRQLEVIGDERERGRIELVTKLLGLADPETDLWGASIELLTGQVGGYYDPESESFAMMRGVRGGLALSVLSHELVHALEDQHFGIGDRLNALAGDSDAQTAFHAVAEGSATVVQNRWTLANIGRLTREDLEDMSNTEAVETMLAAEPVLWLPTLFSYVRGAAFLQHGSPGADLPPERLDRAYSDGPRSTEQVLHPEKYWEAEQIDLPVEVSVTFPGEFEVLHEDTLGELQLYLVGRGVDFVAPSASSLPRLQYTDAAAAGWGGDRLYLLGRGEERRLLLATVWDTAQDREEWAERIETRLAAMESAAGALCSDSAQPLAVARSRGTDMHLLCVGWSDEAGADPIDAWLRELTVSRGAR